jgi:hypothetical protein
VAQIPDHHHPQRCNTLSSFSSDAIKEGHADKILLSDIRSHAGM